MFSILEMEAGPSTHRHVVEIETQDDASVSKVFINLPTNLLIIPPTAAMIGLIIGMSRGGSRARLRFLAENAHRQPRTVQGWVSSQPYVGGNVLTWL